MLNELVVVGKLREQMRGDKGETARYMRSLADAYKLKEDNERSKELRTVADTWRKEIQMERWAELPDDDLSYAAMTFSAYW